MISTDFATNESWDDAILSLKLLLQPWKWRRGYEIQNAKQQLFEKFEIRNSKFEINLFLSGRAALYFLLKSLNLPRGSSVIVQAFTCEAVVLPIIELGLRLIYVDIETDTYSMEFNKLTANLTDKTKVLILQHTFGLTPKFRSQILKLAREKNLIIVEDLAHGFQINETMKQFNNDHYYLLSFGRSKMLSSVFGGAVVSPNNITIKQFNNLPVPSYSFIFLCLLYKPLTMLIKTTYDIYFGKILHKIANKLKLLIPEITQYEKDGNYDKLFNFAYPNALTTLLNHQLNKLEQVNINRAMICEIYERTFSGKARLLAKNNPSLIRYPLLVKNRDEVLKKMREKNIFLGKWYDQVVAPKDLDLKRVEYKQGSCPVAEEICKNIINLPTSISEKEAKLITEELLVSERSVSNY